MQEAGLDQEPAVAQALDQLTTDGRCDQTPTIEALARTASSRHELFVKLLNLREANEELPPHPFHEVVVDRGWGEEKIISEVERMYVAQESTAYLALRYAAHPDAYSAAVSCLDAASVAFNSGRTDRGWTFTEDQRRRRHTGVTENPRHRAFIETANRFLVDLPDDPGRAAVRATEQLPRPLTGDVKDAASRADLAAAVRGDFNEWQRA